MWGCIALTPIAIVQDNFLTSDSLRNDACVEAFDQTYPSSVGIEHKFVRSYIVPNDAQSGGPAQPLPSGSAAATTTSSGITTPLSSSPPSESQTPNDSNSGGDNDSNGLAANIGSVAAVIVAVSALVGMWIKRDVVMRVLHHNKDHPHAPVHASVNVGLGGGSCTNYKVINEVNKQ